MHLLRNALAALMLASVATLAIPAHAWAVQVLYQVDPAVPPDAAQHVGQVLSSVGAVVPADMQAQPGDIAVSVEYVPAPRRKMLLRLTYYDAVTAVALFTDDLPMRDGALRDSADAAIVEKAQSALAMVAPNVAAPPPTMQSAPAYAPAYPQPAQPETGDAAVAEDDVVMPQAERPIAAMLGVGAGVGMYESSLPLPVGSSRVPSSAFPAFDVELAVDGIADGSVTPGLHLSYMSSIGYTLSDTLPNGLVASSAARTHQVRVDGAINVNFGHSRRDIAMPILFGYAWSNLRTDTELPYVFRHTLSGPHLGLELRIPLADESVVLRFGPDVWLLLQVSDRMQRAGLATSGLALGGEAELLVRLSERFALRAMIRESHASVSNKPYAGTFTEAQRFITVGAAATY